MEDKVNRVRLCRTLANCIMGWMAESHINDPIVEAVMISAETQGMCLPNKALRESALAPEIDHRDD